MLHAACCVLHAARCTLRVLSQQCRSGSKSCSWIATIAGPTTDRKECQVRFRALRSDRAAGGSCGMCGRSDGGDPPDAGNAPDKCHELRCDHDLNGTTRARDSQRATGRQAWGAQSGDEEPAYIRHIGDNAERDAVAAPAKFAAAHWGSCTGPGFPKGRPDASCALRAASGARRAACGWRADSAAAYNNVGKPRPVCPV